MKKLRIENSYNVWSFTKQRSIMENLCEQIYATHDVEGTLNRSYPSLYAEWWLHNITYYLTKPLCFSKKLASINRRAKDVCLEEHQ